MSEHSAANHKYYLKNKDRLRLKNNKLADRGRQFIRALKDVPCADCGIKFPSVCMEFDHRPGETKLFSIGSGVIRNIETLRKETAKCDVVCANCHRLRTAARGWPKIGRPR